MLDPISNRPSGPFPTTNRSSAAASPNSQGLGVDGTIAIASTNSNIPIALGMPAVTIGGGGCIGGIGGNAHSPDEW